MNTQFGAAVLAALIAASPALAQTPETNAKPETNCTPSTAGGGNQQTTGSTGKAMAAEKSAIVPNASGHAQSAAPTVQQDGEPMQGRPDCPPDQSKTK